MWCGCQESPASASQQSADSPARQRPAATPRYLPHDDSDEFGDLLIFVYDASFLSGRSNAILNTLGDHFKFLKWIICSPLRRSVQFCLLLFQNVTSGKYVSSELGVDVMLFIVQWLQMKKRWVLMSWMCRTLTVMTTMSVMKFLHLHGHQVILDLDHRLLSETRREYHQWDAECMQGVSTTQLMLYVV